MTNAGTDTRTTASRAGRLPRAVVVSLFLIPIAFVVAMVAGEGLTAALGYSDNDGEEVPLSVALLVGGPMTLLAMAPAVATIVTSRRARRLGARGAAWALAAGWAVTAYWTLTFVAGVIQHI